MGHGRKHGASPSSRVWVRHWNLERGLMGLLTWGNGSGQAQANYSV